MHPPNVSVSQSIPVVINERTSNNDCNGGSNASNLINICDMAWDFPSVLLTNARSICNKFDELHVITKNNDTDIICITESWLHSDILDSAAHLSNYIGPLRNDRESKQGGGVLCYVKSNIKVIELKELTDPDIESLWLTVHPKKLPRSVSCIAVGVIYHPPGANNFLLYQHICSSLDKILTKHPEAGIILLGDFNHFKDSQLKGAYKLNQIINKSTRGDKILDKIFTTLNDFYPPPIMMAPLGRSDHNVIICQPQTQPTYKCPVKKIITKRSSDMNNKVLLVHHLKVHNWNDLYQSGDCLTKIDHFMNTIHAALDTYLPLVEIKVNSNDKPWVNKDFRSLIAKRQA